MKKSIQFVSDSYLCTSCGACVAVCPKNAIDFEENLAGYFFPRVNSGNCIDCGICVDVCPNRANMRITDENFEAKYQILHIENRCNECGNCYTFCPKGGFPYFKKVTLYADMDEYNDSKNTGFVKVGENKFQVRDIDSKEYVYEIDPNKANEDKKEVEKFLETVMRDYPYLV